MHCATVVSLLALVLLAGPAAAGTYRWVDAKGGVHYSDRPPQLEPVVGERGALIEEALTLSGARRTIESLPAQVRAGAEASQSPLPAKERAAIAKIIAEAFRPGPILASVRTAFQRNYDAMQMGLALAQLRMPVVRKMTELEVAPFVDAGQVFNSARTVPLDDLHFVGGVGFRFGHDLGVIVRGGIAGQQGGVEGGLDVDLVTRLVGHLDPFGDHVHGLAAQYLGGREAELAVVGELLRKPVGRHAHLLGLPGHVRGELGRLDAEFGVPGHLVQDQADLDRAPGPLLDVRLELLFALVGHLQVAVQGGASPAELVQDRFPVVLGLVGDHALRQRDVDLVQQGVQGQLARLDHLLHALVPLQLGPGVGAQLTQGVELAGHLGELVVEAGDFLGLDAVHGHRHVGLAARELTAGQFGPEGGGLPRRHADQRLVQAFQQGLAADRVGQAAGLGVLDRLAVHRGGQVDGDVVVLLDRALHALQRGEPVLQQGEPFRDLVRRDPRVLDGDGQAGQVGQLELGPDVDLDGEGQLLAVVQAGDLHLGLAERVDVTVGDCLGVQVGYRVVDRLAEHDIPADPAVNHGRRYPPGPEARDADLAADLAVGLVEAGLQLIERHLDAQPDTGRAQLFDVSLHVRVTPGSGW